MIEHPTATNSTAQRKPLRLVGSLLLGLLLMVLVYRHFDFGTFIRELTDGSVAWWIILLSILVEGVGNIFRGLRWHLQLQPLQKQKPRLSTAVMAVMGNYTLNLLFPRAGDVWRCVAVNRYESISFAKLLGTLVMDRLMDSLCLLIIIFSGVALFSQFMQQYFLLHPDFYNHTIQFFSSTTPYLILSGALVLITLLILLGRNKSWGKKMGHFVQGIWEGLVSLLRIPHKGLFLLYSLGIWVCYFIAFYMTFFAFPATRDLGIGTGLLSFIMGTMALAAPVQGGIGAWHFMVITTLTTFGVTQYTAEGFALVVHTSQVLGAALLGVIAIALLPWANRNKHRELTTTE